MNKNESFGGKPKTSTRADRRLGPNKDLPAYPKTPSKSTPKPASPCYQG